jgi:predicted TPR repeat methyltransferase
MRSDKRDAVAADLARRLAPHLAGAGGAESTAPERAVDIGSGSCVGVRTLQMLGFDAEGVDCDEVLVEAAREAGFRVLVHCEPIEFLNDRRAKYGAIMMRDFVEHMPPDQLESLLVAAREALNPTGVLVVVSPNAFSPMASVMRYIDHTHTFSSTPMSIRPVFLSAGFESVEVLPTDWSFRGSAGKAVWRAGARRALVRWLMRQLLWRPAIWAEYGVDPKAGGIPIDLNLTIVARVNRVANST